MVDPKTRGIYWTDYGRSELNTHNN